MVKFRMKKNHKPFVFWHKKKSYDLRKLKELPEEVFERTQELKLPVLEVKEVKMKTYKTTSNAKSIDDKGKKVKKEAHNGNTLGRK